MAGIGTLTVRLADMPDVLAGLRREMASVLREQADAEPSGYVAERLRAIAAAFEAGQRPAEDRRAG